MSQNKYDRVLLEMLDRIKKLEEEVSFLKNELSNNLTKELADGQEKMTRKLAREYVIDKLKKYNPKLFNFGVASRKNGSGIIYEFKDKLIKGMTYPMYAKFFFSRLKSKNRDYSWFTVKKEDIDDIIKVSNGDSQYSRNIEDIIFFAFDEESKEELLVIVSRGNIPLLISQKECDSQGMYHFYFKKKEDGSVIEFKDSKVVDVTKLSNDYSLLTRIHLERDSSIIPKIMYKDKTV